MNNIKKKKQPNRIAQATKNRMQLQTHIYSTSTLATVTKAERENIIKFFL